MLNRQRQALISAYSAQNVSVVGSGILPGSTCRFGALASVASTLVSSGELLCVSPAQPVGHYPLEITGNMQDFTYDGIEFRYVELPVVTRIKPVLGTLEGGTLVQVRGAGFVQGAELVCKFGGLAEDIPVTARWRSESLLECRSRARSAGDSEVWY